MIERQQLFLSGGAGFIGSSLHQEVARDVEASRWRAALASVETAIPC